MRIPVKRGSIVFFGTTCKSLFSSSKLAVHAFLVMEVWIYAGWEGEMGEHDIEETKG